MLQSRIYLIRVYLANLPPSYLTEDLNGTAGRTGPALPMDTPTAIDYPLLRSMQALLHRLNSLVPVNASDFRTEMMMEQNDALFVGLLGLLGHTINHLRELGRKFSVSHQPILWTRS